MVHAFKKLEVFGFKSFADKLTVDFSGGITAIVGPNGCGKSNVSDAVRWVLGEQSSKTLRGTNMQDVIFKGTESRKPLGYCEVSLYFDNTSGEPDKASEASGSRGHPLFPSLDYSEVVITRKLYKSGESEYMVNRQPCRLKDITHLMHDCGIDRDGLTIISQGQVAEIITGKPEMRRNVFEEAAGIAKFKSKKVEAERKLERTATELDRVKIVTDEIERNIEPLLKQAKAAEEYVILRENLKSLEVAAFVSQYDTAAGEKQKLIGQMANLNTLIKDRQNAIATDNEDIAKKNEEIEEIDKEADFLRGKVLDLSVGAEREQNTKRLELYEKINVLKQERAGLLSKKKVIENLIESGEGYKQVVRKLIESKNKNIIGVVAKELSVPTHLESAIEVALGAAAQNIITADEDGAKQLIELLRKESWGRATFLPLTTAREKSVSMEDQRLLHSRRYVLGIASDLVKYKPRIAPVVETLLGRTVVVDTLENAIELSKEMRYSLKVVTLDGDVIETRGSITGGSKNALNNNLWHNNTLAVINESLESLEARIATLDFQAREYETTVTKNTTEGSTKVIAVKEMLDKIATRKAEIRIEISRIESQKIKSNEEINDLTQAYYRAESSHQRIDLTTDQMQSRMTEEYQMNYSACHMYMQEKNLEAIPMDKLEDTARQIAAAKRRISALGPVNLDAIEQSKTERARYDEYITQVRDLEKAKADLEKVIRDLDSEMLNKFRTSFEEINKNFGYVFKELFGGGHAKLELVPVIDPKHPDREPKPDWLESGIDIVAEPPGKKLSNLTLLSGGEKALTAIAILFAILKHRTMPFCILDEIEAALDEANVARFANYLLKFSASTQFIVITHRKGTMELANHMYGVTMEEKGVSKLVSVKLETWDASKASANIAYFDNGDES